MNELWTEIGDFIGDRIDPAVSIFHETKNSEVGALGELGRSSRDFEIGVDASLRVTKLESMEPGENQAIIFRMSGDRFPSEFYLEMCSMLKARNVNRINLRTWVWDLAPDEGEKILDTERFVTEHVACHLPSPLTGSVLALTGQAFIDMKGAYGFGKLLNSENIAMKNCTLWHTNETGKLSEEEMRIALGAGCDTASPNVVPWAVCGRAFGMTIDAVVKRRY